MYSVYYWGGEGYPWQRDEHEFPEEAMARTHADWLNRHWSHPIVEVRIYQGKILIATLTPEPLPDAS